MCCGHTASTIKGPPSRTSLEDEVGRQALVAIPDTGTQDRAWWVDSEDWYLKAAESDSLM